MSNFDTHFGKIVAPKLISQAKVNVKTSGVNDPTVIEQRA
jgi:hypothetical protein